MVTIIPDNVTRFEGENFKLTCKATHSQVNTPVEISFMWYYLNTQIISNDEMYSISSNNSESQLIIKQLQSQGNVYKCIAIFLSSTDPTIYLSSNNSDVYDISIDGINTCMHNSVLIIAIKACHCHVPDDNTHIVVTCILREHPLCN